MRSGEELRQNECTTPTFADSAKGSGWLSRGAGEAGTNPGFAAAPRRRGTTGRRTRRSGSVVLAAAAVDGPAAELDDARTRDQQLEHALRPRIAIEQAKGILAERLDLSIEKASRSSASPPAARG
jgi:hypothetical protein